MASSRVILIITCLAVHAGCKETKLPTPPKGDAAVKSPDAGVAAKPDVSKGPKIIKDDGPMPGLSTPIAVAGDYEVTVADFEESSRVSLLFAPDGQTTLAPERLAVPHVHITMARSLLSQKIVAAELEKRDIKPTTPELHAFLREHPRLQRFGRHIDDPEALKKALEPIGLTPAQLLKVAWAELGNRMLARVMLSEIADDEIWLAYKTQNTTRTAAMVSGRNVPTSKEIDEWMGDHPDEIDTHFQAHQNKYRTPRRVKLNMVRPAAGNNVGEPTLEEAAALLEKGVQPVTVAKNLALEHELETQLVRGENPRAFGMRPGEVGYTLKGPRGAYAWKVVGFVESKLPEMTRPLRREIAAELLRTTGVVPSLSKKLEKIAKKLAKTKKPEKFGDRLEEEGIEFLVATFPNAPKNPIPKHGLVEEVVMKTYETDVGSTTEPFLCRERGFVIRVTDAHNATRKEFEANIDANRKAFVTAMEPRIVPQWVERRMRDLDAKIDTKPLRIKFGVLQKPSND